LKNLIITGISSGLGLQMCKKFLSENYYVYGISRTTNIEIESLKDIYESNFNHKIFDLSNTKNIKKEVIDDFLSEKKEIHGLINNAAIAYDDLVTNIDVEKLHEMYEINVISPMILSKYVIRNFILNNVSGSLVHISSISVHTGYKGLAMYASTKGAIEAFSKNVAREWGKFGIRSNCVVSGFMDTKMTNTLDPTQKDKIYNRTSLKKPTNIDSVVNTVEFLISEKSNSITGQNIFVDSGTI
jgi:3-oxoacyl-[acyl-carrier protein] reductase